MPRTTSSEPDSKLAGEAIRQARNNCGISQYQLAERLQVSAAYIQKLEAGKSNPTVGQLGNIGRALGMTVILTFEPVPTAPDPVAELADV
jgi:transcriptional regulator with XRE-family HTH domain